MHGDSDSDSGFEVILFFLCFVRNAVDSDTLPLITSCNNFVLTKSDEIFMLGLSNPIIIGL